jgi:hypothetical protein
LGQQTTITIQVDYIVQIGLDKNTNEY